MVLACIAQQTHQHHDNERGQQQDLNHARRLYPKASGTTTWQQGTRIFGPTFRDHSVGSSTAV